MGMFLEFKKKSGKRDSDPRPQPWQGCALPTELFPLAYPLQGASLSIAGAKVRTFFHSTKYFPVFFQKNVLIHSIFVIFIGKTT